MPVAQQGLFISDPAQLGADTVGASEVAANAIGDSEIAAHTTTKITVPESLLSGPLAIARGGTGQATQTPAFDALSPLTTQGDIIYFNGTDNVRLGPGTDGQFLKTQGAGANPIWASVSGTQKAATVPKPVTVTNTTTETDLINFTLGANELSTNNLVHVKLIMGRIQSATSNTMTIRCYYGATSISFSAYNIGAPDQEGYLDFFIAADGATNDQQLTAQMMLGNAGYFENAAQYLLEESIAGAAAIDSTAAQTVKVTAQWNGADASDFCEVAAGYALIIK